MNNPSSSRSIEARGPDFTRVSSTLHDAQASAPVSVQSVSGASLAATESDLAAFHGELRQRSLPILFWSGCVFNSIYVAFVGFDYLLAPELFTKFLWLRLGAFAFNTLLIVTIHRRSFVQYTWEGFWLWLLVKGTIISLMLSMVDASVCMAYILGFTLVVYGAGLLPYWPPRWAFSIIGTLMVLGAVPALSVQSLRLSKELIASSFIVLSSGGLAMIMAYFKYLLMRRDFFARRALTDLAQREHGARVELDDTSNMLRRALEQLKELDRLKSQFFANISHELRTPLTLILTPLENLRSELQSSAQRKNLSVVQRNAERLLRLIDELLELSRLDAGGLRLNIAEVDLRMLASGVFENAQAVASTRGIDFELLSGTQPLRVFGDAHRLEIVLTNLVSNALKFTDAGGSVRIELKDATEHARIDVRDTGSGIGPSDLPFVFERFFQAHHGERRRNRGGVGIGLALAKELTELHGGELTVRSRLGEGTTFSVLLPYGREHIRPEWVERRQRERTGELSVSLFDSRPTSLLRAPATVLPPNAALPERPRVTMRGGRRARVLVAEDQEELREFIVELLAHDYDVTSAQDGAEALALARTLRPDLIISDVMMPELSGAQLCYEVKALPELRNTPVILLTARVGADATLDGYAHGADDFVGKPFDPRVLLARVRAQLLLRKLALDLAEREKLATIGALSAGILHEVRNPVNAILNAARVLSEGPVEVDVAEKLLSVVGDCAERIHALTESLDAHARPADGMLDQVCDVAQGLDATLSLLGHRLQGVSIERHYEPPCLARGKAAPLNQVFLNLLDNALCSGAKRLSIRVVNCEDRLEVRIADDGPGVANDLRERIFDAFVSGRAKGSGLGLYLSRSICEQHGGTLVLEDGSPLGGAAFLVSLLKGDRS